MSGALLLLRHPPVAKAWAGRCYGQSDMGWSREGRALAAALVEQLAGEPIDLVVHSGARRARLLADAVARHRRRESRADPRWLERDFGDWEGRRWDAIWHQTGDLMDRLMTDPHGFRPGVTGETGAELSARVQEAWHDLPRGGTVLVVAHGGPIAALRAALAGAPLEHIVRFVPRCGEIVEIDQG